MAQISILTTQNVYVNFQIADIGDRLLGFVIDVLIQIGYLFVLSVLKNSGIFTTDVSSLVELVLYLPIIFYTLVSEYFMNGQTIGKKVAKTKVIRLDGGEPTIGNYVILWLFRLVDIWLVVVGLIVILLSSKGQRIGDMLAGTTVVKIKFKYPLELMLPAIPEDDSNYEIVFQQVANLSDDDIRIIRDAYKNASYTGNYLLLDSLATKTKQFLGISTSMDDSKFIRIIIQDYNHFHSDPANSFAGNMR